MCPDDSHASDGERALSPADDEPVTAHKRAASDFDENGDDDEIVQDENEFNARPNIAEYASEAAAVVVKSDVQLPVATVAAVHKRIVRARDSDEDGDDEDDVAQNGNDGQDAMVVESDETYNAKRRKMIFDDDD